jgi:hypothetical protein
MVQRSKRSMSPDKAARMQAEAKVFHHRVRIWPSEIPIGSDICIALDVLNFALHLAHSQFNRVLDANGRDPRFDAMYRSDIDFGE